MTPLRFISEAAQQNQWDRDRSGKWPFLELHKADLSACLCLRGWPTCSLFRFGPPQWLSAHFQDPCSPYETQPTRTHFCIPEQFSVALGSSAGQQGKSPCRALWEVTSELGVMAAPARGPLQGLGKGGFHRPGQARLFSPQQTPPPSGKWESLQSPKVAETKP